MDRGKRAGLVVIAGGVVLLFALLFPPWKATRKVTLSSGAGIRWGKGAGRSFLPAGAEHARPDDWRDQWVLQVAASQLALECLATIVATTLIAFAVYTWSKPPAEGQDKDGPTGGS